MVFASLNRLQNESNLRSNPDGNGFSTVAQSTRPHPACSWPSGCFETLKTGYAVFVNARSSRNSRHIEMIFRELASWADKAQVY